MAVPRFYIETDLHPGSVGSLNAEQTRQVRSVLRLGIRSEIVLFNGTGIEACARIAAIPKTGVKYEVISTSHIDRDPPLRLTVGLAVLRGDRFDLAVQKLTEIGVCTIVPLVSARCVVSFDDASARDRRVERYRRVAREAAEQSERATVPDIRFPISIEEYLLSWPVIAMSERSDAAPVAGLPLHGEMAIAVGPEGGWDERERKMIAQTAAAQASLGTLILRAETAAIVAAGTLIQRSWKTARA